MLSYIISIIIVSSMIIRIAFIYCARMENYNIRVINFT